MSNQSDLDINRGVRYDLAVVRTRLRMPTLIHEELLRLLCERVQELDLKKRVHQLHLPSESARMSFVEPSKRIANIRKMLPVV